MKILLDECVDWRLLRDLAPHGVRTVRQLGWARIKNGALLKLAAAEFDAFITVDAQLPHQQNVTVLDLAVIVLRGRTTRYQDLPELLPLLREALATIGRGELKTISWRDVHE